MREIKFRIWNELMEKMCYPTEYIKFQYYLDSVGVEVEYGETEYPKNYAIRGDDIKLMQYTGLKDKNGVEIYEFDYITADESVWHGKIKGLVMWNDKMCGFRVIDEVTEDEVSLNNCSNIEVVGHYFEVDE